MPSAQTPIGLVAVFKVADGWRASVADGNDVRATQVSYASARAALLAVSRLPADTPWLVKLHHLASTDAP